MRSPILIGIAGGTGSGKTLVAETLITGFPRHRVVMIQLDSYYKDLSHLPFPQRERQNFDHPDAIDEDLLIRQIRDLVSGKEIERPIYDFSRHVRKKETVHISIPDVIILEGILVLHLKSLRDLLHIKVFVDADPDIRLIRRLKRDLIERQRTLESILQQYEQSVRPMHVQFVEPSRQYADLIIPEGGKNTVAIDLLKTKIEAFLGYHR